MKGVFIMLYKLLDVHSALQDRFRRVLGQNCKFCTTDPKEVAISEIFTNSEILQTAAQNISLLVNLAVPAKMFSACWLILGPVVHSEAFLSTYYKFITPKQHLDNAHNIK
jgi:hypothetical protein